MSKQKPTTEAEKQIYYRDARYEGYYGDIWTSTGKCVFCDLRDKYVLFEEDGVALVISLYAYIDGQMMIVTRRHVETASELTNQEWETVRKLMHMSRKIIKKVHGIGAVNFVQRYGGAMANNTVPHFHVVVVPFDDPTLAVWNYRKLKNTPLENTELYKEKRKALVKAAVRFDQKYAGGSLFTVLARARLLSGEQVLVKDGRLPGLYVDDPSQSIEKSLATYINKELSLSVKPNDLHLVTSRITTDTEVHREPHLNAKYPQIRQVVENVYEHELPDTDGVKKNGGHEWVSRQDINEQD